MDLERELFVFMFCGVELEIGPAMSISYIALLVLYNSSPGCYSNFLGDDS